MTCASFSLGRLGGVCRVLAVGLLGVCGASAVGQTVPLPSELTFLSSYGQPYRMTYEPWTEDTFPHDPWGGNGVGKLVSGKHWDFPMVVPGATRDQAYAKIKAAFLSNGWTTIREWSAGGLLLWVHYQKGGVEAWGLMGVPGENERAGIEVIEAAPVPVTLALVAPAAQPEVINPTSGDIPYLGPIPGTKFHNSAADPAPFMVTPKGANVAEQVAPGSIDKVYTFPDGLSNAMFRRLYHDALTKAGWVIVDERMGSDVAISAHYTQTGRNIWASLHKNGEGYDLRVADAGAATAGLSADLAKNCHVALYGVLFDFNKATLQAVSDPVLQQILGLLTKDATLKLEIQGHTDNVGGDAYNQTLSEARAKAVVAWLTQHGVAATRLTAKGFGKTVPIADNNTDAGRAKNRRVEIADPRCAAKGK